MRQDMKWSIHELRTILLVYVLSSLPLHLFHSTYLPVSNWFDLKVEFRLQGDVIIISQLYNFLQHIWTTPQHELTVCLCRVNVASLESNRMSTCHLMEFRREPIIQHDVKGVPRANFIH